MAQRFVHGALHDAARRAALVVALAPVAACVLRTGAALAADPVVLEAPSDSARAGAAAESAVATGEPGDTASAASAAPRSATHARVPGFLPPLTQPPLDPPLTINGGFGEYRPGHFHAGVDLGTGERVGKPVHAPLAGWIARVRTSGVGYGRSLYLQARDGRLLQFGHLDAFAGPLAAYVAAVQESTGQYEQDLWLEAGRYPARPGDLIAWTGESGAGGPHLHFEVRRGDMAYNPFRAGLTVKDVTPPTLLTLTLEPLDDVSFVERSAAPFTLRLGARRETLRVEGRVRAEVDGYDGAGQGARRIVPWSMAASFDGRTVECRFDSLSWATDMSESDYVFDAGRITGDRGLVLWAPAGFRPRVMVADVPRSQEAGTIVVGANDPPRRLTLVARDAAGQQTTRTVVLRPPRGAARGADSTRAGGRAKPVPAAERFEFAALPGGFWRMVYRGAPRASRGVVVQMGANRETSFAAGTRGADWAVVIPASAWQAPWYVAGRDSAGRPWDEQGPTLEFEGGDRTLAGDAGGATARGFRWSLPRDARFEPGAIAMNQRPAPENAPPELARVMVLPRLEPEELALRRSVHVAQTVEGVRDSARTGLYRKDPDGWTCVTAHAAAGAGVIEGDSRRLGTFALFADTLAPRITATARPPRAGDAGPYSRWALEARIAEDGSGLDVRASGFEVDGVRVPTEWDGEQNTLRWRPRAVPASGTHRFTVVARDRAGNEARSSGTFVID